MVEDKKRESRKLKKENGFLQRWGEPQYTSQHASRKVHIKKGDACDLCIWDHVHGPMNSCVLLFCSMLGYIRSLPTCPTGYKCNADLRLMTGGILVVSGKIVHQNYFKKL